jgi:hypothetical protein
MFTPGNILYFNPFYFKDGTNKRKYFIVLRSDQPDVIVASLPTSIDHIPGFIPKKHGCINIEKINFNCYLFIKEKVITDNGWSFPIDTYVYGGQVDTFDKGIFEEIYAVEGVDYELKGKLVEIEFENLKKCIINSLSVKRKIRNQLSGK